MLPAIETLIRASIQLECSLGVRIRSLALFHQFNASVRESHDTTLVAAAALKCAAKYEEEDIEYHSILLAFWSCMGTDPTTSQRSPEFDAILRNMAVMENVVCRVLSHDFGVKLAHDFLLHFLAFMLERNHHLSSFHGRIARSCVSFANDAYTHPLSVWFKPEHLAVACLHASLQVLGLLKRLLLFEPWFQGFCHDLSAEHLGRIECFLFGLYKDE